MEPQPNFIASFLEGMDATRWALLGVSLLGLEVATGTTYLLWPAAAGIILAGLMLVLPISWEVQFVLFFILSIILLVVGHLWIRPLMKSGTSAGVNDPAGTLTGRKVVAFVDFENGEGRVSVGDGQWKARLSERENSGNPKVGDALIVTAVIGTTLEVKPAEA